MTTYSTTLMSKTMLWMGLVLWKEMKKKLFDSKWCGGHIANWLQEYYLRAGESSQHKWTSEWISDFWNSKVVEYVNIFNAHKQLLPNFEKNFLTFCLFLCCLGHIYDTMRIQCKKCCCVCWIPILDSNPSRDWSVNFMHIVTYRAESWIYMERKGSNEGKLLK